ncbi:MAG: response regulator [Candidatus Goldiibacteriota bacterium]
MEKRHIKVLLVEDNEGDVRLIWEILSEVRNSPFYLEVADTLKGGLKSVEENKPDVILLDLSLPDSNGIYTLNRIRDKAPGVPVVIMTGLDDELVAMKALKEGAQDYLVKGRTDSDLLKRAILYAIERNSLFIRMEAQDKKLRKKMDVLKEKLKEPIKDLKEIITEMAEKKSGKQNEEENRRLDGVVEKLEEIHGDAGGKNNGKEG